MEWSPTNPFLSPEILSGEPTSISSSLFGSVSRSVDAITRPSLVAIATHEYSAAAAPAKYERAPVAHRFDSASRFDSSQTPPPFDFQPSFPAEPHSDVSAQVLQLEAEIRQLQLELRALEQSKSDSRVRLSAGPTAAMSMPTQLEKFVARQTDSSMLTFSGAATEWPVFYQIFTTSTDSCAFSDAENLARLNKSLKGKARELVQSLLAIPQNVPSIIRTLQMRYGRPDIIVRSLIKKVQALPSVDDKNLIDFAVAVQNLVTTIVTANAHGHMHNPQLMSDLVSRLPSSLRLQWGEQVTHDPNRITLAGFSTWLSAKAEALRYVISKTADSPPVQLRRLCWLHLRLVHLSSTVADNLQSALSVPISIGATNAKNTQMCKVAKHSWWLRTGVLSA